METSDQTFARELRRLGEERREAISKAADLFASYLEIDRECLHDAISKAVVTPGNRPSLTARQAAVLQLIKGTD